MSKMFRIGLTRDFLTDDGCLAFNDIGLGLFDAESQIEYEFFDEHRQEVGPDQIVDYDAVISYMPKWTEKTFTGTKRLTLLARFGVGYDMVDVSACTENDVLLSITPDGIRTPMAEGTLTLVLAMAKQIVPKQDLLRDGRWAEHKFLYGSCLANKTVGTIGMGNIGGEFMRLLKPFGLTALLAYDPFCSKKKADSLGVTCVRLESLLKKSDFVVIHCPLNEQTRGLVGEKELNLMKPTAFLINTARGPIINQTALTAALHERRIAGAALDVFEKEPLPIHDPLLDLDNVILLPHAIGWTEEGLLGNGRGCCQAALNVSRGTSPQHVVNSEVLDRPGLQAKLQALTSGGRC